MTLDDSQKREAIKDNPRVKDIYSRVFDTMTELGPGEHTLAEISESLFPKQIGARKFVNYALVTLGNHDVVKYMGSNYCAAGRRHTFTDKNDRNIALKLDSEMPDAGTFYHHLTEAERLQEARKRLLRYDEPEGPAR